MENILYPNPKPLQVAVRRGLPSLRRSPRVAALVALLRSLAALRGQSLDRFEVVPEGVVSPWQVDDYWVVSDLPHDARIKDLHETRRLLGEQLHVRVSGGGGEDDGEDVARGLERLVGLVEEANDGEGTAADRGAERPTKKVGKPSPRRENPGKRTRR